MSKRRYIRVSAIISLLISGVWLSSSILSVAAIRKAEEIYSNKQKQSVKYYSDQPIYSTSEQQLADHNSHLAVLDEQVDQLRNSQTENTRKVDNLSSKIDVIKDDISTMKGFGAGIGALLGFLQFIQVFLQLKRRRWDDRRDENDNSEYSND